MSAATAECPKHMRFGPCGGVRDDGGCEVPGHACAFVGEPLRAWTAADEPLDGPDRLPDLRGRGRSAAAEALLAAIARRDVVTADLPSGAGSPADLAATAARLAPVLTAVVAGDPPGAVGGLAPVHRAALLTAAGLPVIAGMTCRDRNRVAIEGELAAYADLGVAGVLAVTGDHPRSTARTDAMAVFDLDATRVAALAARAAHLVAVAEQPAALGDRVARLAQKVAAGAELCVVNLCGGAEAVAAFAAACRAAGITVPLVAAVPVVVSVEGADRLTAAPGVVLPASLRRLLATSPDPRAAGIAAAVDEAAALRGIDGLVGVHLSAVPGPADPSAAALVAEAAAAIRTAPA